MRLQSNGVTCGMKAMGVPGYKAMGEMKYVPLALAIVLTDSESEHCCIP